MVHETSTEATCEEREADEKGVQLELDEDLLTLSTSTLTALTDFLDEQEEARNALLSLSIRSLPEAAAATSTARNGLHSLQPTSQLEESPASTTPIPKSQGITVETFKGAFKENWQLSQFWYAQETADRLTEALKSVCNANDRVAFLCCPTGYVAFKESGITIQDSYLFEHDTRFAILGGTEFIYYDLDDPLSFKSAEALRGSIDVVVVDPPFHSEASQRKVCSTVSHIIRRDGLLVLLTGLALSSRIDTIYPSPPLPKIRRRDFSIEHDGVGRLETPYGCWVGGDETRICKGFGNALEEDTR